MDRFMEKCLMDRKIVQLLKRHFSFNKISKRLGVSKNRIRKIRAMAVEKGYLVNGTRLPPFPEAIFTYPPSKKEGPVSDIDAQLLEHLQWIKDRREASWHLITIFEELPIKVPQASFYRFVRRHGIDDKLQKQRCRLKVVSEIHHAPGEALLLDWGKLKDVIDPTTGKKRTVWFLAGVLGHSRYMMVRLVWDFKTETTLNVLEDMFNELGGTPARLISDNPKCFSIEASKYEPLLNPAFERFCDHYHTIPEILPPGDPEKKGKIERMVPFVRRIFEAHGDWRGLEYAQEYLNTKVRIANQRKHGTTKQRPADVFLGQEASALGILPSFAYEIEEYHHGPVRKDGCVRFRNKYYSVGSEYCGKNVFVIGNSAIVQIYFQGKLLDTHSRIVSSAQSKSIKKHHLVPMEQSIDDWHNYASEAEKIGPCVKEMILKILCAGNGFLDYRKIWGILSLNKSYSNGDIDRACQQALACSRIGYRAVLSFLTIKSDDSKSTILESKDNKFVRDMSEYAVKTYH